jgi:hypothetical protein
MSRIRHEAPRIWPAAWAAALVLTACASNPTPAVREPGPAALGVAGPTPTSEIDAKWAGRGDPGELAKAIEALERAIEREPASHALRLRLAEAHALMAQSIVVLGWKDQRTPEAHLAASEAAALTVIDALDHDTAEAMRTRTIPGTTKLTTAEGGAALYWLAAAVHAGAELAGYQALALDQAFARRVAEHALPLNDQVDRGGLHRLLASIAAHPAAPQLRDLERAREHADRALAIDSGIANTLAYVEHYAIPAQDRAAITDKLQQLTEQRVTTPEDALARARVEQLTARIEDRLE